MKIKATIYEARQVEVEIETPSFFKNASEFIAIFSEDLTIRVFPKVTPDGYCSLVINPSKSGLKDVYDGQVPSCTREEFFEALNKVLSEVKYLEEATDLKVAI